MNRGYQSKQQKKKKEMWSRSPLRAQIKAAGCNDEPTKKIVRDLAMNSQKIYGF
jgi:hypothetical protein